MRSTILKWIACVFGPCCAGLLLVLAFPNFNLSWIAWIALIPLLLVLRATGCTAGFFCAYLCGIIYFSGVFAWAFEIPKYRIVHHIMLGVVIANYFGFFGWGFCYIKRRMGQTMAFFTAPVLWVVLEFIRSNVSFLSLPWPLLAHSQYQNLHLIQVSSITGAFGLSFLVVMVNCSITSLLIGGKNKRPSAPLLANRGGPNRGKMLLAVTTLIVFTATFTYGHFKLSESLSTEGIRIALVQGNIGQSMKAKPRDHAEFILQKYTDLTLSAAKEAPDLIVWPEAATPGFILKDLGTLNRITSLIRQSGAYFIIGSSEYSKFSQAEVFDRTRYGNTALYFSTEGRLLAQYLKIRLIPFGEEIPFEGKIKWPDFIVSKDRSNYEVPGKEYTLFNFADTKLGVVICWESQFPKLFRKFVQNGATLMVNITNDGWFGKSAAPYQMLVTTIFRAVENRVSIARAANTGVSCFIDPCGRIIDRVQVDGEDIFVDGHITREVPFASQATFYTRFGEVFTYCNLGFLSILIICCIFINRRG